MKSLQCCTKPQGMASTRWNLSDLFGVLTLPYGFRQNWNAKQNSKSFKAVNRNCQVLQSQLRGGETMGGKRGTLQKGNDLILCNLHLLSTYYVLKWWWKQLRRKHRRKLSSPAIPRSKVCWAELCSWKENANVVHLILSFSSCDFLGKL